MKFKVCLTLCSFFAFYFTLFKESAWAWGPGIHLEQGEFVLNNVGMILPSIQEVLRKYPLDFLYGCISADIFIGKGSRRRDDHCHNWSIALNMLSLAEGAVEKAFTYGYLSHLAADTIAHNYYIPNQLYLTSTTRKFGHLYWEYRSDAFTEKRVWKVAKKVIASHHRDIDLFASRTVPHRLLSFRTKKKIFGSTLRLYELDQWWQAVKLIAENSRWEIEAKCIASYRRLSFSLTMDFLRNPETAVCMHLDPVGSDNIRDAKKRRRLVRRISGRQPQGVGFEIPVEVIRTERKLRELRVTA
jgi:hypothetical protein